MFNGKVSRLFIIALAAIGIIGGGLLTPSVATALTTAPLKYNPGHYMRFGIGANVPAMSAKYNLKSSKFAGVNGRYLWRDMEPRQDVYNFDLIERDLEYVRSIGKRLIVQVEPINWGSKKSRGAPDYLAAPLYNGGFFTTADGRVMAKRYNPQVNARFAKLLDALAKRFDRDPYVEAIVMDETALDVNGATNAGDYSAALWVSELKKIMTSAKASFTNTNVVQLINYINGGGSMLGDLVNHGVKVGMDLGCPDVVPGLKALENNIYPKLTSVPISTKLAYGIERSNYQRTTTNTVPTLFNYGVDELRANYMLWSSPEPIFSEQVIPYVNRQNGRINY